MTGSERKTHVQIAWDEQTRRQRIRELNDRTRRYEGKGQVFFTPGIQEMGTDGFVRVIKAVYDYDAFTPDNDPHDEHDSAGLRSTASASSGRSTITTWPAVSARPIRPTQR